MKRWIALGLVGGSFCATAWADMIETKKDGILNGKILSENSQEVRFKNEKGQMLVFKKKDILFEDKEDPAKKMKLMALQAWEWVKDLPKLVRKTSDQLTEKFIGKMSAPLDRSAANAKSEQLAKAMDDAGKATASMTKKATTANAEIYRQKNEGFGSSQSSTEKKGHFASLDS